MQEDLRQDSNSSRVVPTSPVHHTGADFAGPLKIKRGYTRKTSYIDVYVCVFVCMATKAVHLEMVLNLTTPDSWQL